MSFASVDVCVIGSGFGGGTAALRAAEAGASVMVLEQGKRYDKSEGAVQFKQTQADLEYLIELFSFSVGFDATTNAASVFAGGRGLGGGSLVYSMVSLRAPGFVFDEDGWPDGMDRSMLDPYYLRSEEQIGVVQTQWTGAPGTDDWLVCSKRDAAFAQQCENAGVSAEPVPVAINNDCENLGWCSTGCTKHGKNSVDLRYINPAEDLGAAVLTNAKVNTIGQAPAGNPRRWLVQSTRGEIAADNVVVACGAVGSPALLQVSRDLNQFHGGLSAHVGKNLSRGGDMMVPIILPEDLGLDDMEMAPGKIIGSCSFEYLFEPPPGFGPDWQKFIMQPMMILPMISSLIVADPDGLSADGDIRMFGEKQKHLMQMWGDRLLHIGVMGMDGMDGTVSHLAGVPIVNFKNSLKTRNMMDAATAGISHVFDRGVGGKRLPSMHEIRPDAVTIHPLGSVRMADSHTVGGTNRYGQVYKGNGDVHEGLFVCDASLMSSPIAVNTSLTTAALAEVVAEKIVE